MSSHHADPVGVVIAIVWYCAIAVIAGNLISMAIDTHEGLKRVNAAAVRLEQRVADLEKQKPATVSGWMMHGRPQ